MAVEWNLEDDEDEQISSSVGGEQTSAAPTMASGEAQPSDAKGSSSGSYTNLQKYVDASKGTGFSEEVGGKLQSGADEGLKQLGEREQEFRGGVESGKLGFDEEFSKRITEAPQSLGEGDLASAKRLREGQYSGPTDFGGGAGQEDPYGQLRNYFGDLGDKQTAAGAPGGQRALLEEYYDRPTYSEGQKSLDELILSGNRAPVQAGAQAIGAAQEQYGQKREELGALAGIAKEQSDAAQAQYRQLLGMGPSGDVDYKSGGPGLIQDLYGQTQERAGQEKQRYQDLESQYRGALGGSKKLGDVDAGIREQLGLADMQGYTYGVDPGKYLQSQFSAANIDPSAVATQEELARMQALSGLAGVEGPVFDEARVGSYPETPFIFDTEGFKGERKGAIKGYGERRAQIGKASSEGSISPQARQAQYEALAREYGLGPEFYTPKSEEEKQDLYPQLPGRPGQFRF
jgi:hypothetical protein